MLEKVCYILNNHVEGFYYVSRISLEAIQANFYNNQRQNVIFQAIKELALCLKFSVLLKPYS